MDGNVIKTPNLTPEKVITISIHKDDISSEVKGALSKIKWDVTIYKEDDMVASSTSNIVDRDILSLLYYLLSNDIMYKFEVWKF